MSFNEREISNQDGKPIGLYEFNRGTIYWRYTSADRDITYDGDVYEAVAVSNGGIAQGDNDDVEILLPADTDIAALYRGTVPSDEIFITVRELHEGDDEAAVYWVGTIAEVGRPDEVSMKITGRTLSPTFRRGGLRLTWGKNCENFIYDHDCGVDPEDFKVTTTLLSSTGNTITPASIAPHGIAMYAGGYVQWAVGGGAFERRFIQGNSGSELVLFGGTDGMTDGMEIFLFPGCPRIIAVCDSFYDNKDNFGGIPHKADKSPFDGDPVF